MNGADRTRYKEMLLRLKASLNDSGHIRLAPNRGEESDRPDDDFQALNEMHQSIASGRNKNRSVLTNQIELALELIEEDPEEFGLCEDCGEAIPKGRLDLMPYTPCCVACQSAREGDPASGRRRSLTDYIS